MPLAPLRLALLLLVAMTSLPGCTGGGNETDEQAMVVSLEAAAPQGTRSFQMALWFNSAGIDADIAFFAEEDRQPDGLSILFLGGWWNPNGEQVQPGFASGLAAYEYDWSRIAAVVIDEPYWYNTGQTDVSNPCRNPSDPRNEQIARTATQLGEVASVIRELSPSTRLWVNFSVSEMQWASDSACPIDINQWYIDVVSLDSYWGSFDAVARPHYEWLLANRATAYQQLALVPGTFYRDGVDNQHLQAGYLPGYFGYANSLNQACDLPIGRVGVTGLWDGCPVWIVAGWTASSPRVGDYLYRGALDPSATVISAVWRETLAHPTLDPIVGLVETYDASARIFKGWTVNRNTTGVPQQVELWVNGQHAGGTVANLYRADVGDVYGIYEAGFSLSLPAGTAEGTCLSAEVRASAPTSAPHNRVYLPTSASLSSC